MPKCGPKSFMQITFLQIPGPPGEISGLVAVVVARGLDEAQDAAELVTVDYEAPRSTRSSTARPTSPTWRW